MAKLTINAAPTFFAEVAIPVPGKGDVKVKFEFKHRTRDDKRASVVRVLELRPTWSARRIGEAAKVSHEFVRKIQGSTVNVDSSLPEEEMREGRDGKLRPATMPKVTATPPVEVAPEPEPVAAQPVPADAEDTTRSAWRFACEWHDAADQWFRAHGNENWAFGAGGFMAARHASINDLPIAAGERRFHRPPGCRPDDHPGRSALGLWA